MRVLIIKTSSLGDVIHTFPAVTDAAKSVPGIRFDWLVEEAFAELPAWHPAVERVIPVALRRWRGRFSIAWKRGEIQAFTKQLRDTEYDVIIDAQGLLKSAAQALIAKGPRAGYDKTSGREPLASRAYQRRHKVSRELHAVERIRRLFAAELGYQFDADTVDYGIQPHGRPVDADHPYLVFLHATTWPSKHWPAHYWAELAHLAGVEDYQVLFPWYAPEERLAAERIIGAAGTGKLMERLGLSALAGWLGSAVGVAGVDTGLAHLAAAMNTPAVTLYGPTRLDLTGAIGPSQRNLQVEFPCAPCLRRDCDFQGEREVDPACFASLPPHLVWQALKDQMAGR